MSGHSRWSKIKRQKGANDAKRGALFTKFGKNITLAASEGGGDPSTNFALRLAIEKARIGNMPSANIERAVKRGTGKGDKINIVRVSYEAMAGDNVALIIDCQTDNTNRTVSDVRKIVESLGGKLGKVGSVSWQFNERGLITVEPARVKEAEKFGASDTYEALEPEETQLELLEIEGIIDISEVESEDEEGNQLLVLEVLTEKTDFSSVLKAIEEKGFKVNSAELIKTSKDEIRLEEKSLGKISKLIEALEDHEDVDSVWSNVK